MTAPTRVSLTGGRTAFIHMPYDEVTSRLAKARRKGHPMVFLCGRRVELSDVAEVHPPTNQEDDA